jgi:hypothetical protein
MGQKKISHSEVVIPAGEVEHFNIDAWALYLKKALTETAVTKFTAQKVSLILGQRFFQFARVEIPTDIQDSAIDQYVKSKIVETFPQNLESATIQYFLMENRGKKFAQAYILTPEIYDRIKTLLSFYELTISDIYPESLLIFDLFSHTLNKTKEEPSLFLEYDATMSYGLLFDAIGLCSNSTVFFASKDMKDEIKKVNSQEKNKLARLILSGTESTAVRQDNFTKDVGVWTNPLQKILPTSSISEVAQLYGFQDVILEYSRELVLLKRLEDKSARQIAITNTKQYTVPVPGTPSVHKRGVSYTNHLKTVALVVVSFAASYFLLRGVLASVKSFPSIPSITLFKPTATPAPTAEPIPTTEPTPAVSKDELVIEIQNGVGTPGLAGRFRSYLEKQKYTVESATNADNYDYEKTLIISSSQEAYKLIKADLTPIGGKNAQFEKTSDTKKTTIIIGTDLQIP